MQHEWEGDPSLPPPTLFCKSGIIYSIHFSLLLLKMMILGNDFCLEEGSPIALLITMWSKSTGSGLGLF